MKGKGVIFDLDGTLLDTLQDLGEAMNVVLQEHGFPVHAVQSYRFFMGNGMDALVRRALPEKQRDEVLVAKLVEAMRVEYGRRWSDHTRVYPGVPEMLDELETRGLPKAILTNHLHYFTVQLVEKMLGAWSFTFVQGVYAKSPRKPDPAVALEIAAKMELPPAEIVFLGDSGIDMQTASLAGMYGAGVLWGFHSSKELLEAGAKILLSKPRELFDVLR